MRLPTPLLVVTLLLLVVTVLLPCSTSRAGPTNPADNPVELGRIAWHRSFDQATEAAKEAGNALLVVFQEVPG